MASSFWRVTLPGQPYATLTYQCPSYLSYSVWQVGLRVLVPLGKSIRIGFLLEKDLSPVENIVYKEILWPVQKSPSFSPDYLDFLQDLGTRQAKEFGYVLASIFPSAWKKSSLVFDLSSHDFPFFHSLQKSASLSLKPADLQKSTADELFLLGKLWTDDKMQVRSVAGREEKFFQVLFSPPWQVRPAAKRQLELLDLLWDRGILAKSEIRENLGSSGITALGALQKKGLVGECRPEENEDDFDEIPSDNLQPLTARQQEVLQEFFRVHFSQKSKTFLVHGVTGSGKTRVYLEMIRASLTRGENVFLLAPEVAIALQLFVRIRSVLGEEKVFLFHGNQGVRTKENFFDKAAGLRGVCIVGTRSALFLPLFEPTLIILDEEHDSAFKQEERLVYQAKELAWYLIRRTGGTLVLGSATPDIKTFFAAQTGKIEMVQMHERVADRSLPEIETVDLKVQEPIFGGIFSRPCHQALKECLEQGEQVMIMHNRRGYAPIVYCQACANPYSCPHCQITLTYHKKRQRLVCHYCGFSVFFPSACPVCGGLTCSPSGEGTEKLEEYLREHLPEKTGILRLDRDTTRRKGQIENILDSFGKKQAQVLIGTQMLSKGHDFPDVTLVLVVDGDMGLNVPDYRGTERTFQLLVQVAGRAGRGGKKGRVMIQTRNPEHYCWQYIRENNYLGFYERELSLRRQFSYPPFICLALIRMSFPVGSKNGEVFQKRFAEAVRLGNTANLKILGPVPSPLAMLGGRLRFQCMVKAHSWQDIRSLYLRVQHLFRKEKSVRILFDPDPLTML